MAARSLPLCMHMIYTSPNDPRRLSDSSFLLRKFLDSAFCDPLRPTTFASLECNAETRRTQTSQRKNNTLRAKRSHSLAFIALAAEMHGHHDASIRIFATLLTMATCHKAGSAVQRIIRGRSDCLLGIDATSHVQGRFESLQGIQDSSNESHQGTPVAGGNHHSISTSVPLLP